MALDGGLAQQIQNVLIHEAGFEADLFEENYRFADHKTIALAGFAFRPLDARSACIGVVTLPAAHVEVSEYRQLAAPLLLMQSADTFDLWRVGSTPERDWRLADSMSVDGVRRFIRERPEAFQALRIYEAKTAGRLQEKPTQLDLFSELIDTELLPFVEGEMGEQLTQTVVDGIQKLVSEFGPHEWVIKAVFRLLAGKILRDKLVPGFKTAQLSHVGRLLRKVERHYGSRDLLATQLSEKELASLQLVMEEIQQLGDLRNLTTESLGDVYEQALITKDIRKIHGTHKTPTYLVDYMVWQLANWIHEIPIEQLRFFEPGCGHAPFLVSVMRLLRGLDLSITNLSQFFRERFTGVDNDPFALEIARLSLTLADEPNSNGWNGLQYADMYAEGFLEEAAAQSTVLLTNPPYETRKAEELLHRTLPNLPVGAVFGAVIPATFVFSDKPRAKQLRSWMIDNCQIAEVDLFPDGLFTFGEHECMVIIGRVLKQVASTNALQTRLRRVADNEEARRLFQSDFRFTTTRIFSQKRFSEHEDKALWIAEFQKEIWDFLKHNQTLSSIADVNQGLQHEGRDKPANVKTVESQYFLGSKQGFASSSGEWELHDGPPMPYLNLSPEAIRRGGAGTDCVPQVLMNYHRVSRGIWCLKPFIDVNGRPFLSTFLSIRARQEKYSNLFLWALLVSPVAHLYVTTHTSRRDIFPRLLGRLPIPFTGPGDVERVAVLANRYLSRAQNGPQAIFDLFGYTNDELMKLLLDLDAEVLRLYRLPARAERLLLEQFRGLQRPGVPIPFTEYYPPDTANVPLYAYRSNAYQRWLNGKSPELSDKESSRYRELIEKGAKGKLTQRETNRLHELQAEMDGRDFAIQNSNESTKQYSVPAVPDEFEQQLRSLSDRAVSAVLKRSRP